MKLILGLALSTFIFWIEKCWASREILKEKELERVREQTESVWEREREQRESVWERERESKEKDGESVCVKGGRERVNEPQL